MNKKIKDIKQLYNDARDTLSRDEIVKILSKLDKKPLIYNYLKKKPELKSNERGVFKKITKSIDKFYTDLSKKIRYQKSFLYGLEQLFNKDSHFKPIEIKSALEGNYVLYESNGDDSM